MRRNLAASLFEHGAVRTTEPKAKDVRRFVEKLITIARKGDLHARRLVISRLQDRRICDADGQDVGQTVVQKLFDDIAPRYADRPGGYTRIIRLSDRRIGDSGVQVLLQLVEEESAERSGGKPGSTKRRARAAKMIQAASKAQRAARGQEDDVDEGQDGPEETEAVDEAPVADQEQADAEAPVEDETPAEEEAPADEDARAEDEAAAPEGEDADEAKD